jgi:hypothetical protein
MSYRVSLKILKSSLPIYQFFGVLIQRALSIKTISRKPTYRDLEQRIKELEK